MLNEQNDIDPASLEIFKTVLESPSGKAWLDNYIITCLAESHIVIRCDDNGVIGYVRSYRVPYWVDPVIITIKPEDSWLKKWIKRQLM